LEAEAPHWPTADLDICVAPIRVPGAARPVPPGVRVDTDLARYRTRWRKAIALAVASCHVLFVRELVDLIRGRRFTPARARACLEVLGQTLLIRRGLQQMLAKYGGDVVVYAYWHTPLTYAAVLLKRTGRVRAVLARGHNSDIYEASTVTHWQPLKRQLIADIDHTWTVSEDGRRELVEVFGGDPGRIGVARLGVTVPVRPGPAPDPDRFRVLSVSSCTPVKQVPMIAEVVARLAHAHPEVPVEWTHFGGGPLLDTVRELADRLQAMHVNLTCSLPGHVENSALMEVLDERAFDVLVNASRAEGVPVSIMEAMSRGIPAIAPAVGGVAELVGADRGWLLSSEVSGSELGAALTSALTDRSSPGRRQVARRFVAEHYDADLNYERFAADLLSRARRTAG
jgi:glycosyltransferase involved in cell wall biosynthesis